MREWISAQKIFLNKFSYSLKQEIKSIFLDKAVIISVFVFSIAVAFLYTWIYSREALTDIPIAVIDQCNTTESRNLIRMIDASSEVNTTQYPIDLLEAKEMFLKKEVFGIVVIPSDFSSKIYKKERVNVSAFYDTSYFLYYKQVYKAVAMAVSYMNVGIEVRSLSAKGMSQAQAIETAVPIQGKVLTLYNPNYGYASFAMPMVYVIIIQTLLLTGIGLLGGKAREAKEFLDASYRINTVADVCAIILGKSTSYVLCGLLYITIVLGIITPLFNINQRGDIGEIYLFFTMFLYVMSFLGLFLVRFFRHREDSVMTFTLTSIPCMILSGFAWPHELFPWGINALASLIPSTYGVKGMVFMTQCGASLRDISEIWAGLCLLGLFYFTIATLAIYKLTRKFTYPKD